MLFYESSAELSNGLLVTDAAVDVFQRWIQGWGRPAPTPESTVGSVVEVAVVAATSTTLL